MLDIKFVLANPELVQAAAVDKKAIEHVDLARLVELEEHRLLIIRELQDLKAEKNRLTKKIAELIRMMKE